MSSTNKTANYNLSQFLSSDVPSWISDYTADMQKIDKGMNDNKNSIQAVQPDEYSSVSTYLKGDYCINNNTIYKANTDIDTPEEFNPLHWDSTTIYDEFKSLNSRIHQVKNRKLVSCQTSAFYTGISITIPANSFYVVTGTAFWSEVSPTWVGIASSDASPSTQLAEGTCTQSVAACTLAGFTEGELTLYLWAQYSFESSNRVYFDGFYISKQAD